MSRLSAFAVGGLAIIAALALRVGAQQAAPLRVQSRTQSPKQEIPAFRSRVTLVPLDVRVLDRDGKPVTDLKQEDFTVLENNEPQTIAHFWATGLVAEDPPSPARPLLRQAPGQPLTPPRGRTFLLVVGRGRIQQPFDGIGALITFVRERLLPQDRVAVIAYNRATDFTTDHEKIVALLQRIGDRHERIEALLEQYASGIALPSAKCKACLPDSLVPMVNEVFLWPGAIVSREMPQSLGQDEDLFGGSERRFYDALLEADLASTRDFHTLADEAAARRAELSGASSASEYASLRYEVWQDRDKMLNGISEMRYFEGEKHLVFLSETGVLLERREEDVIVARAASDARIAMHMIVSGGIPGPNVVGKLTNGSFPSIPLRTQVVPVGGSMDLAPAMVMKNIAAETGGTASVTRYPREALATIDEVTRFEYLLGYYPASSARDGKFRDVKVTVNRPGVQVLVRGGYYDEDVIIPGDRAAFLAHQRMATAGSTRDLVKDLAVSLEASQAKSASKAVQGDVTVDMRIDPARVVFEVLDGRHVGTLDFRIYCSDPKEHIVGELHGTMKLNLSETSFQRYRRDGIPYSARVPVKARPKTVKVIVYDPASDLAGSMVVRLR